jgi:Sigma-70, region 4
VFRLLVALRSSWKPHHDLLPPIRFSTYSQATVAKSNEDDGLAGGTNARIVYTPMTSGDCIVLARAKPGTRGGIVDVAGGLSYAEAAAALRIPQGMVMSWLYRGRQQIARRFGGSPLV